MTKRKAIMYLIILAVLVTAAQIWKTNYLSDPASKLPDPCKMVISGQCQQYINKITAEKKIRRNCFYTKNKNQRKRTAFKIL